MMEIHKVFHKVKMSNSELSHCMTIFTEIGLYFVVAKKNSFQSLSPVHKCLQDSLYS